MSDKTNETEWGGPETVPANVGMVPEMMHAELRDMILERLRDTRARWDEMSEAKQSEIIAGVDADVTQVVVRAVTMLSEHRFPSVRGVLDQVVVKDGLKAVVKIAPDADDRHEIVDAVGSPIHISVADPRAFMAEKGQVKADPDQTELSLREGETE